MDMSIDEINVEYFRFYFLFAGGIEMKIIDNMGLSMEFLYNMPQYYNWKIENERNTPYNIGIGWCVSYLF